MFTNLSVNRNMGNLNIDPICDGLLIYDGLLKNEPIVNKGIITKGLNYQTKTSCFNNS